MVAIHLAYTALVNRPGATPQLTLQQAFKGLERKARHGEEFVSAIETTDVIEESVDPETQTPIVVREVVFRNGVGPAWAWTEEAKAKGKAGRVRERCVLSPPNGNVGCKVDFYQPDGSRISNILSQGREGELYMTYAFEWFMPEIAADDDAKIVETRNGFQKMAEGAVESSIDAIREMVKDGRIPS